MAAVARAPQVTSHMANLSVFGRRGDKRSDSQEPEYWLSYSDLMAGLLMVFALLLMAALHQEGRRKCQIEIYERTAQAMRELLDTRQRVIRELQERFDGGDRVVVDSAGTVRFAGSLLFDQASAEVSPDGRVELGVFAREYFPVLLDNAGFRSQLERIVVEGHTNDDGPYELNLALSHSRSLAVMQVLLTEAEAYRDELEQLVTANGRSFADLVYLPDGSVDKASSRRIEIQFQLDDRTLAERVLALGKILIDPECEA